MQRNPGVGTDESKWAASPKALLLGVGLIALAYSVLLLPSEAVDTYVQEDGIVEWIGALGLFAASGLFFWIALRSRGRWAGIKRLAALALAIVFFFGGGEEISWGQRLLGFETPQELSEANAQDETNVHNLEVFDGLLSVERLFQLFWIVFAVLIPIVCALAPGPRRWLGNLLPIMPLAVAILLIINQLLGSGFEAVLDANPSLFESDYPLEQARFEVTESVISVLLAAGAAAIAARLRSSLPATEG
jgi:hypothetical protein